MQLLVIQRILGVLLIAFSLTLLPPMAVSIGYQDGAIEAFILAFGVMFGIGILSWWPARKVKKELHLHDGFIITAVFWSVLSVVGALPFLFNPHLTIAQSVFEAVSGFTTTGATVIDNIEQLPKSILYYRQQLQWFGGLGIIVMAVAVLPMLGIGGMQLYRAETPGPMRDDKLTPRLEHTAKALLYIYITLTISCALAYWLAGMTLFDAISHHGHAERTSHRNGVGPCFDRLSTGLALQCFDAPPLRKGSDAARGVRINLKHPLHNSGWSNGIA